MKYLRKNIAAALAAIMAAGTLTACGLSLPAQDVSEPLPAYYSLVDEGRVTAAKCQYRTNLCWAYSSTCTAESALITAGLADRDSIDLSEGHLVYSIYPFTGNESVDGLDDGIYLRGDPEKMVVTPVQTGGAPILAGYFFANGHGPANEADAPLDTDGANALSITSRSISESLLDGTLSRDTGDWLLTGMSMYDDGTADDVKRAIMREGAVSAGMMPIHSAKKKLADGSYTYYSAVPEEEFVGGHAISIIGWDDDFSKDSFVNTPSRDGAWILMDSTDEYSGEDGIIYMSYDEILTGRMTMQFDRRDNFGGVLYYDLCALNTVSTDGGTTVANIFTADKGCAVRSVGVTTFADGQQLEITVYKNPEAGRPDSGKRAARLKTTVSGSGYRLIDLREPVALKAGETFSVVVKYRAGEGMLGSAPVEGTMLNPALGPAEDAVAFEYIASNPGESFILVGREWHDTSLPETADLVGSETVLNNAGIKAVLAGE